MPHYTVGTYVGTVHVNGIRGNKGKNMFLIMILLPGNFCHVITNTQIDINMCTHAHTHTHTHAYTRAHTHTHAYTRAHTHTHAYTHARTHTHAHAHTRTHTVLLAGLKDS